MVAVLAWVAFVLAGFPARIYRRNLSVYLPPPAPDPAGPLPRVSVLIPARNEVGSIEGAVTSALESVGVELEVLVLDDHSDDATPAIVRALAERDARVRLLEGPELPDGWCGKQYACWTLARNARCERLLFLDADVRLAPDGLARLETFLRESGADLVSGIPFQETRSPLEQAVIPLIHVLLLGFLPLERMRASRDRAYGAGCGQLLLARRTSYDRAGGHAAIRDSLHDGITLPRAFRAAGLATDVCDATTVARCRMYRSAGALWHGLAKNAGEGFGSPRLIVPATLVLLFGQVLPPLLLALSLPYGPLAWLPAAAATACSYFPRAVGVVRFGQPCLGALLHPFGVLVLLAIQWSAAAGRLAGRPRGWKGRTYRSRPT